MSDSLLLFLVVAAMAVAALVKDALEILAVADFKAPVMEVADTARRPEGW